MCGICGTVGRAHDLAAVERAMERMRHRGPDQSGTWSDADAVLGHRRLSILDLSERGRQPLANEDGRVQLVFNGEIYGFRELHDALAPRHAFRSRADSEVLVHGYEEWGIDGLLSRIRGMFALAIWDARTRTLHLVRDHLGKKPLYFSALGGGLVFASTMPALLELLGTTPEVSPGAVLEYLTYLSVPSPATMFEGVQKLPPATRLELRAGEAPKLVRYWRPDLATKDERSEDEWLERIDAALRAAVRERMVADVPLGAFLSGGIDSSLVVSMMSRESARPVTTISVGFDDRKLDELSYARRVASHLGTEHHEEVITARAADILPSLVFHASEPLADHALVATYYLAKAARRHVTVVLTGDGGDETFAGYQTTQAVAAARLVRAVAGPAATLAPGVLDRVPARARGRAWRAARWAAQIASSAGGAYRFDAIGTRTFRGRLDGLVVGPLEESLRAQDPDRVYRALWEDAGAASWVDRALYVDMLADLPNTFLPKIDVATMAHSLEARCPFLDVRLVELGARIPSRLKLKRLRTKHLLRELALRHVPREIVERPKHGLSLPVSEWLRRELSPVARETLLGRSAERRGLFRPDAVRAMLEAHETGREDHGHRIWSLLMLELWHRMFVDKDLRADDMLDVGSAGAHRGARPSNGSSTAEHVP